MRLIDADMIEFVLPRTLTEEEKNTYNLVIKKAFDNTPTVNAIPVEWIKNYARRKASKGFTEIDCYWQYWEEDVLKMVADWEEENERKTN